MDGILRRIGKSLISLIDKLTDRKSRMWYAQKTIENGWSKTILDMQIDSRLMERSGQSVNTFLTELLPTDSDLVNQVVKVVLELLLREQ